MNDIINKMFYLEDSTVGSKVMRLKFVSIEVELEFNYISHIFSKARIDVSGITLFMSPSTVLNFNVDTIDNLKVLGKD
jgi:hypothetical protein